MANASAKDHVKLQLILIRIAAAEKIQVGESELMQRIYQLSEQNQVPMDKFIDDLKKRNAVGEVREQVLCGKVLDFLQLNAKIEDPWDSKAWGGNGFSTQMIFLGGRCEGI